MRFMCRFKGCIDVEMLEHVTNMSRTYGAIPLGFPFIKAMTKGKLLSVAFGIRGVNVGLCGSWFGWCLGMVMGEFWMEYILGAPWAEGSMYDEVVVVLFYVNYGIMKDRMSVLYGWITLWCAWIETNDVQTCGICLTLGIELITKWFMCTKKFFRATIQER